MLLEAGFSVQQIAERLEIDVEAVRKVARQYNLSDLHKLSELTPYLRA